LIAGLAVYLILSYLFVPLRVTIPLAIIMSVLIFGLSKYYAANNNNYDNYKDKTRKVAPTTAKAAKSTYSTVPSNLDNIELEKHSLQQVIDQREENNYVNKRDSIISNKNSNNNYALSILSNLFFVVGYAACLLSVTAYFFIFNPSNEEIFVPWEQFTIIQIIELGASIALCFFLPGYALLSILFRDPDYHIRPLLKILLAYLLSILVTGLTGYTAASAGLGLLDIIGLFVVVYLSILIVVLVQLSLTYNKQKNRSKYLFRNLSLKTPLLQTHTFEFVKHLVWNFLKRNSAEFIVFASLFALVVLSTYSLYSGVIIGDQWYHHGRSLAFMSGEFRDISLAGADDKTFSPFPSALLAAFFSVSGVPSVNAYASISFLNIIPVFAFYYFFKNWVPIHMKKAALLACTLFMLGSGFGWVYVLDLAIANPPESQLSTLQMLYQAGIKSIDIILPTSFIGAAHPDFSTPLIIMALPAGFTLLGLLSDREEIIKKNKFKFKYLAILISITFLGIISHDEFYLFIIVASVIPIFLFFTTEKGDEKKKNLVVVYSALVAALVLTLILATYSFAGVGYFIYNSILGIPLLVLCLIFVTIMCILYVAIRFFYNLFYQKKYRHLHFESLLLSRLRIKILSGHRHRTIVTGLVLVFVIAWLYVFTFVVWSQLSVDAVEIQTFNYAVPWYLYPMKLGITGLLGFAFVLSYLFKKFEKKIFVFGIIVVVAFFTAPYYDEQRFSKYIMVGLTGFASLFIYNMIIKSLQIQRNNRFRTLATSLVLGIVILSSALSVLMFWGYNASAHDSDFDKALGRRDFPSVSALGLFNLLRNSSSKDPLSFNVAAPANEYAFHTGDLIGKVHAFSGIPWIKLMQSPLTLNASTLEGFYDLLYQSDTRYIVLPKKDFVSPISEPGKDKEIQILNKVKQETNREEPAEGDTTIREVQKNAAITSVLRFAIENFQKVYEDSKYLMLAVPPLTSPQSEADIGLIIPKSGLLLSSLLSNTNSIVLQYNNHSFKAEEIGKLARSGKIEIATTNSILHGDKGEITTIWSNPIKQHQLQNANYIEATFRILGENKTSNDVGIMWNDGNTEYTASVRNDRLEILVKPTDVSSLKEPVEKKLVNVRNMPRENGIWYTLEIITTEDYVNVYINDMLAVQVPKISSESHSNMYQQVPGVVTYTENRTSPNSNPTISRVGLFSFDSIAEFKPLEIGQVPLQLYKKDRAYFEHYYPLNILSLSKLNYETFIGGDPSVFSKKIVLMDMDSFPQLYSPTTNSTDSKLLVNSEDSNLYVKHKASNYNSTDNKFLEFAKQGGTLIITNIVNPYKDYLPNEGILQNTELEGLFSIQAGDEIKFDKIAQHVGDLSNIPKKPEVLQQPYLNVSGVARDIKIKNVSSSSSDFKVISFYVLNNNEVVPFALEKKYGAGRIIVVNSGGYFKAIASSPQQYFHTLGGILGLLDLNAVQQDSDDNVVKNNTLNLNAIPITRVVGDLKVSGHSLINSSSFSIFANKTSDSAYNFHNDKFHVLSIVTQSLSNNGSEGSDSSSVIDTKGILQNDNYTIFDAVVRDLKLYGEYEVIITLNGSLILPSTLASYYDYIAACIPTGFNMTIKLHDGATAEFIAENGKDGQLVRLMGEARISFSVMDLEDKKDISVLLKSPEIRVINGTANFEKLYMYEPYSKIATDGVPLDVKGNTIARFGYLDTYDEIDSSAGWINTQYLTYLKSIHFGKSNIYNNDKKIILQFPADISELAKEEGVLVPWQKALLSSANILTSLSILAVAVTLTIFWRLGRLEQK
jgi:hypothetical protein